MAWNPIHNGKSEAVSQQGVLLSPFAVLNDSLSVSHSLMSVPQQLILNRALSLEPNHSSDSRPAPWPHLVLINLTF